MDRIARDRPPELYRAADVVAAPELAWSRPGLVAVEAALAGNTGGCSSRAGGRRRRSVIGGAGRRRPTGFPARPRVLISSNPGRREMDVRRRPPSRRAVQLGSHRRGDPGGLRGARSTRGWRPCGGGDRRSSSHGAKLPADFEISGNTCTVVPPGEHKLRTTCSWWPGNTPSVNRSSSHGHLTRTPTLHAGPRTHRRLLFGNRLRHRPARGHLPRRRIRWRRPKSNFDQVLGAVLSEADGLQHHPEPASASIEKEWRWRPVAR